MGPQESNSLTDRLTPIAGSQDAIPAEECLVRLKEALIDLYELLEQYAPTWYTQAHRDQAKLALNLVHRRGVRGIK